MLLLFWDNQTSQPQTRYNKWVHVFPSQIVSVNIEFQKPHASKTVIRIKFICQQLRFVEDTIRNDISGAATFMVL